MSIERCWCCNNAIDTDIDLDCYQGDNTGPFTSVVAECLQCRTTNQKEDAMKLTNDVELYCKTFGQYFKLRYIAKSVAEANYFTGETPGTGVLSEDRQAGMIFIADVQEAKPA